MLLDISPNEILLRAKRAFLMTAIIILKSEK